MLFFHTLLDANRYELPERNLIHRQVGLSSIAPNSETDIFRGCADPQSDIYYREAIPSIDNPRFVSVQDAEWYIEDSVRILGITINGEMRGYPYNIMNRHEIVNDFTGNSGMGVTYCPITGSGIGFNLSQLENSTIGVTGLLFESNLVFYDRRSDTCFSQMLAIGMSGEQLGLRLEISPVVETTWATWKLIYPDSKILSIDTGFSPIDQYFQNDYVGYENDTSVFFQTSFLDREPYNLYHPKMKTMVLKSYNDNYLFPLKELAKNPVSNHELSNGDTLTIIYDKEHDLAIPYFSEIVNGSQLVFELVLDRSDYNLSQTRGLHLMKDQFGTVWNIRGEAIDGPMLGSQLRMYPNYEAYWYAAIVFHPSAQIYTPEEILVYAIIPENQELFVPDDNLARDVIIISSIIGLIILVAIIARKTKVQNLN